MCERNGTTYAKLQDQSRRGFLKTTSAASATLALPAALGAALIAGVGAGIWPTLADAQRATVHVDRTFEPDAAAREFHDRAYARFQKLSVLPFP